MESYRKILKTKRRNNCEEKQNRIEKSGHSYPDFFILKGEIPLRRVKGVYHKTFYCNDLCNLSDGDHVLDIFLLTDIQYCSNDRGIKWLSATLEDITGVIRAKIWSDKILMEYEGFKSQIVVAGGTVNYYAGKPEITIDKMVLAKVGEYEITEVIKTLSNEKIQVYKEQVLGMIENISSQELRKFVSFLISEKTLILMSELPVHLTGHHAYRGALLEHVSEVVTGAYTYVKSTSIVRGIKCNLDIVIAGALLHDIGCTERFKKEGFCFSLKEEQKILSSKYLTCMLLETARRNVQLNTELFSQLYHVVETSHQGLEPSTLEAMVVHSNNQLSAELDFYENSCLGTAITTESVDIIWSKDLKRELYRIRGKKKNGE